MYKFLLNLFVTLLLSSSYGQDFTVTNYEVAIVIHEEGYFDVVENYDVNFHRAKHGIFRTIQTKYDLLTFDGNETTRKIKISNIEVPGHKSKVPFKFQRKLSDDFNIRIGDPDRTVIGAQHYEIEYRVENAFLHEDDLIRFYWNIKPDGWSANFNSISFTLHLPDEVSVGNKDLFVYSGLGGSRTGSEHFDVAFEGNSITGSSVKGFVSKPGESVTVLLNLPLNSVAPYQPFWPPWTQYLWIAIIGAIMYAFYLVWKKHGKDDPVPTTTSFYPPKGMDPAMAGFLIDDREDTADLISLLPYWGKRGIIKIQEIPRKNIFVKGDTKITRLAALPQTAPDYEKKIFKGLFGSSSSGSETSVLVSSLKDSFYTTMGSAKQMLKKQAQIYYVAQSTRVRWIAVAVLLAITILFGPAFLFIWGIIAAISLVLTTVTLLILSPYLVKKNPKGNDALTELKGFKRFIAVSEERKLKMLLDEDPNYFESTMSYALAFGLFANWSRKFEKLNTPPPSWYSSSTNNAFTMHNFTNSFNNAMTATQSTMVSSPSSSSSGGGGSSGGGFGGGGGGSW